MDEKLIQEINEKTPILDLVSEFVSLSKRGKNYMGLCPFHQEKTPSFSVSPEKNIAKCMSCGEGGTPITFYRSIKNISFEEAATELAIRAGIKILQKEVKKDPYETFYLLMEEVSNFYAFNLTHSVKGKEVLAYLEKRKVDGPTIEHFRLGYAPAFGDTLYQVLKDKGYATSDMIKLGVVKQSDDGSYYDLFSDRLIFPITNPKGKIVGLSGRTMNPKDQVKYINSPETPIFKKGLLLYHLYESLAEVRREKQVILYEGFFDVITSYRAGIKHGIASMGTALTAEQAKLIKSMTNSMVIAYDGDKAGLKATEQAISILERENLNIEILTIPEKMDPDDFIKSYGFEAYERLFSEFLMDPYQFRYGYYKQDKNLNNSNDIKAFQRDVKKMLQYANDAVKAIYQKRLLTDLGIPLESASRFRTEPEVIKPKVMQKKTLDKYVRAEYNLLFAMLRNKALALKILKQLKRTDFADHIAANIRYRIQDYYKEHDEMNLDELLDRLPKEERDFFEQVILEDWFWKTGVLIAEDEIKDYVMHVKDASLKRRLDYLNDKIKKDGDQPKLSEIAERDKIIKMMKYPKEV